MSLLNLVIFGNKINTLAHYSMHSSSLSLKNIALQRELSKGLLTISKKNITYLDKISKWKFNIAPLSSGRTLFIYGNNKSRDDLFSLSKMKNV